MNTTCKFALFGAFALASSLFVSCTPGEKGAVVGGATGAAVGAAVGDGTGAVIGGAVGAVAGSRIAKRNARRDHGYYY
ncbi:MAG: glycine zipper domain-containing protein [Verrucomicrobiales bacterium]|nr:glycine zipper domain-containing protein [Verrucomicrobiales bacterium]